MKFNILTIFPHILDSYINESIIKKACHAGLIEIEFNDIRNFSENKHSNVDDTPYGGGPGMVLKVDPIYRCLIDVLGRGKVESIIKKEKMKDKCEKIILLDAGGKSFTQKKAEEFSKLDRLVLICGRYEGVDARVDNFIDEKLSIGPYVLSGGELPAMVVVEAISRLLPGVLGSADSLKEESHKNTGAVEHGEVEYPQYTRPDVFLPLKGVEWQVPEVLLSGNHKKIETWRNKNRRSTK